MDIIRKKILWVSKFAPLDCVAAAGNRSFNYYFKHIQADDRFDITLICTDFNKHKKMTINENSKSRIHFIAWDDNKLHFIKLLNLESKYNPFNRYAALLSNVEVINIKKQIRKLKKLGYTPDIVILEWTNMVVLSSYIRSNFPQAKIIATEHDVTFLGYKRKCDYYNNLTWKIKYCMEKKLEIRSLKECDLIFPYNYKNVELLETEGIDAKKIRPLIPFFEHLEHINRLSNNKDILFYGAMGRQENYLSAIWFIDNVMPLLKDIDVRFVVMGSNPPESLLKYSSDRIVITGFVDSIEPYFATSMCFVAPLVLGAGIKIKVLEALSSGIPVLGNEIAIEGIDATDNVDFYYCETAESYAKKIADLYNGLEIKPVEGKKLIVSKFNLENAVTQYISFLLE